ncbi:MAG: carboxypeptidase regulatory-like domain-containing protein [Bryobacterales bacterium]|nr:carboxypeptidase regulatory-like domain-containing protein [Bryobacterales bacterium]
MLLSVSAFSQTFTASLTGLVTDPSAGAVPGATVKLRNTATSEERTSTTSEEGRYTFSQLQPGTWELNAESRGFRTYVQKNIVLTAAQSAALNITMQLGDVSQSVEVISQSLALDTQSANQSLHLDQVMVQSLPTNLRSPFALVHAVAGVTAPATGISQSVADQNHNRFGFNGGRSTTNGILIDGVSAATGNGWNGLIYSPSVDSVQEVQIVRNTYDAQFGRSGGGVISVVTKGGGAQYHGTVFDFLRNSALDANSWANNRGGLRRPQFQRNQFGGNLSGPIWKSKRLFFFGGYEGLRQGSPSTSITTLPTALERAGDFSQTLNSNGTLSTIFNPFSGRPNPNGTGVVRDAFPGNRIPATLFDPVGVRAVGLYPDPNNPGDRFTQARNYQAAGKSTNTADKSDIRIDWAKSEKHSFFGRYSRAWRQLGNPPAGVWQSLEGTGPISSNPRNQSTVGWTWLPNPTLVVNVLGGHGYWTERQRSQTYGQNGTVIGLPASLVSQFDVPTIPQLYPANYSNISHSRDLNNNSRVDNLQVNITKEKSRHSLKFGFAWEANKTTGGGQFSADFSFNRGMTSGPVAAVNSTTTGNAIASMLLGTGSGGNVPKPALLATNRVYYAGYFQDTWRVTPRLTLNPGVRYDVQRGPTERFNRFNNFHYNVPSPISQRVGMNLTGGLVYLDTKNRHSWNTDWTDFAPRMGLSYKVTEKMVVRTGYGMFYPAVLGTGDATGFSATTPWVPSVNGEGIMPNDLFRNPFPNGLVPALGSSQGLLTNLGLGVGQFQRDRPNGYMQNYSFDIQYEAGKGTIVEVGYTGNQGRHLSYGIGFNDNQLLPQYLALGSALDRAMPNPFFGVITTGALAGPTIPYHRLLREYPQFNTVTRAAASPGGSTSFNAMLVKVTKQFSSGLMLMSSYQWSKCIDNIGETEPSPGGAADGIRNFKDLSIERSLSAHDLPHSFVTAFVYDFPFGRGRKYGAGINRVLDAVVGGWNASGMVRFDSGLPVRLTAPSTISQYGFGIQLPNIANGNDVKLDNRTPERWFNTAAFTAAAPFTIGTSPRRLTGLRAAGQKNADMALLKTFKPLESVRVQFRAEVFNLTNTPQFTWPDTAFGSTTFGVVTGTRNIGPRNVQFGLKVDF